MATWEERMAAKAADRESVRRQAEDAERDAAYSAWLAEPSDDEAVVARYAAEMTVGEAQDIATNGTPPCACVGPPPGCKRCGCKLLTDAAHARLSDQTNH